MDDRDALLRLAADQLDALAAYLHDAPAPREAVRATADELRALRAALAADAAPPEPAAGETSEVCSACNGTGAEPEYREEECPRCKGRGAVYIGDDPDHCGQCGGTGSAVTPVYRRLVLPAPADAAHPEDGYRCPACGDGIVLATCDRCHETWIGERAAAALDARTADAAHGGERTCGVCGGPLNCEGSCQAKPIGHAPAAAPSPLENEEADRLVAPLFADDGKRARVCACGHDHIGGWCVSCGCDGRRAPSPEAEEECECGHQRREHAGPKPGYGECFHGHASQRCACECFRRPGRSGGKP